MWTADVVTAWTTVNGTHVPTVAALLQSGDSAADITAQPVGSLVPDPNAVVWRVTCSAATLDAIAADAGHVVLTSEELPDANA